jgi:hypothetical protein
MEERIKQSYTKIRGLISSIISIVNQKRNLIMIAGFAICILFLFLKINSLNNDIEDINNEHVSFINESFKIDEEHKSKLNRLETSHKNEMISIQKTYDDKLKLVMAMKVKQQKLYIDASNKQPDKLAKEIAEQFDFDLVGDK